MSDEIETPPVYVSEKDRAAAAEKLKQEESQAIGKAEARRANKRNIMFALLAAEPKESVRIRKEIGPQSVTFNGARFNIPAGIPVEVPKRVAEALRNAELI